MPGEGLETLHPFPTPCPRYLRGGQSDRTEPSICGISCYLWLVHVRTELNSWTSCWCCVRGNTPPTPCVGIGSGMLETGEGNEEPLIPGVHEVTHGVERQLC